MSALPNRSAEPRMSDYDAEKAGFRLEVPEVFNPVIDIVEKWAAEAPEDLALVSLDGEGGVVAEQTVADLALESRRAARALLDAGVGKGDRVFIMLPRVPAWYTAMLGAIRIGAVVMPALANTSLRYQKPTTCRSNGTPYCFPFTCQPCAAGPISLIQLDVDRVMSMTLPDVIWLDSWPPPHCW